MDTEVDNSNHASQSQHSRQVPGYTYPTNTSRSQPFGFGQPQQPSQQQQPNQASQSFSQQFSQ